MNKSQRLSLVVFIWNVVYSAENFLSGHYIMAFFNTILAIGVGMLFVYGPSKPED